MLLSQCLDSVLYCCSVQHNSCILSVVAPVVGRLSSVQLALLAEQPSCGPTAQVAPVHVCVFRMMSTVLECAIRR
jgi:hypothetical protein